MKDKQKQIEEMASFLIGKAVTGADSTKVLRLGYLTVREISETLYNAGYRKIPEGAVVLTREEHIQMLKDLANSNEIAYLSGYGKGSTETAEKFAERLKKEFMGVREYSYRDTGTAWGEPCIGGFINNKIDEICKEITEGKNE